MTRSLLAVLTLMFCVAAQGVSFNRCVKPGGEITYSNVPCGCLQFQAQSRTYSKCTALSLGSITAQKERAPKSKQNLNESRSYALVEERRNQNEKRRKQNEKKEIESKKQRVLDEMAHSFKNHGSVTYGSLLMAPLVLAQKRLELAAINNELEAKDRELDKYRSLEEVALLKAERARARQKRKESSGRFAEKMRQNSQEQRSKKMNRKINDIADKLGVW